jgi:hypothetical protein
VADLLVRQLLRGAHQAVARVGDHDVDPVELGPGAINDAPDRRDLGQVELGQPQPVAIYSAFRSFMTERSRKVPAMRSPRASNCSVMMRPKPLLIGVERDRREHLIQFLLSIRPDQGIPLSTAIAGLSARPEPF